jgi:aerotaxis receptor
MVAELINYQGPVAIATHLAALTVGACGVMVWFQRRFALAITDAQRFANDLAGCNLATAVADDFPPPMGPLIRSLKQIQTNLRAVIGDVRVEIGNFTDSAQAISEGGIQLAERTHSQAQSLQDTSASMDVLASMVQHTAEAANQVSVQSAKSTEVALAGGAAVHRVGQTMQAIDASSAKVQEIISVIEGIAFQTNILALNAAVEAARAGDQGRGFAVVAAEVRALAQRSAQAAREIRELIASSTQQISEGTRHMQGAGSTIDALVASVQEMGQLVQKIGQATQQQESGIVQVNQAVGRLDSVTQQNSALVEHSAASAEGLNESAVMLNRSAQVFQLP